METQIYIADLAAYNAGFLRGEWIDANQSYEDLSAAVANMLLESPKSNIPCTVCNSCGHINHYATLSEHKNVSLASINGWIDTNAQTCHTCDSNDLRQTVTAEEFAIHDTDGIEVGEYSSLEAVAELAEQLAEHGEAYQSYIEWIGSEYATPEGFEESFQGEYDSEDSFAENYASDTGMDTENYFDWAQFTYDLFMDFYFVDGFVFCNH